MHKMFPHIEQILPYESSTFYEIEMKALLTREQYDRLRDELPNMFDVINSETIHTLKFTPGDIRLRHSDKRIEVVVKDGDPTTICRLERQMDLQHPSELKALSGYLQMMSFTPDRPWTKYKQEFACPHSGHDYVICLQDIKEFAYLLEVEHLSEIDDSDIHERNLREIIASLGIVPVNPADFQRMIAQYKRT